MPLLFFREVSSSRICKLANHIVVSDRNFLKTSCFMAEYLAKKFFIEAGINILNNYEVTDFLRKSF